MLIGGAGGHAVEILDILLETISRDEIAFFDNVTEVKVVHGIFPVLKNEQQAREWLSRNNEFCIGVGSVQTRLMMYNALKKFGGELIGVRASSAEISNFSDIDRCADICKQVFISSLATIGAGTLINAGAKVHHHVKVGKFCEISPGATLLGGVIIGDECTIGSGAIILPKTSICSNVLIGGGTVVIKHITEPGTYVGNPARKIK